MKLALWIAQLLLTGVFGIAGVMKTTSPIPDLAASLGWPGAIPPALVRFIGAAELAAAIGLVVPAATGIAPVLTPLAGAGLVLIMVLAALFHLSRGEFALLPVNVVLGGIAAFVAWGRMKKA